MTHILLFVNNMAAIFAADITITPGRFGPQVLSDLANPVLTAAQVLIPAAIAISGIHKLMEHRETAGSLLIELVTKGGGTLLIIQLIRTMING